MYYRSRTGICCCIGTSDYTCSLSRWQHFSASWPPWTCDVKSKKTLLINVCLLDKHSFQISSQSNFKWQSIRLEEASPTTRITRWVAIWVRLVRDLKIFFWIFIFSENRMNFKVCQVYIIRIICSQKTRLMNTLKVLVTACDPTMGSCMLICMLKAINIPYLSFDVDKYVYPYLWWG